MPSDMDYLDLMWFEDRWRALVKQGWTDAEAFEMLERGNPKRARQFLDHHIEEFLTKVLDNPPEPC